MIVQIPEDIYSYEHRALGNFTKRQIICGIIAIAIIFPVFVFTFWKLNNPRLAALLSMLAGFPVIACSIFKKDGQYLEKILLYRYRQRFKYPQKRKFVMSNLYEVIEQNQKEYEAADEEQKANELQKGKKSPHKVVHSMGKKKDGSRKHSI
ncbi:MAG TPA: PrgI family protein [Caproicibacter sp.]|nr:PrgI family protein [Caproicibacter sp.]